MIYPSPWPKLGRLHWHQASLQVQKQADELTELHTSWDYVLHVLCNDLRINLLPRIRVGKKERVSSFSVLCVPETYIVCRVSPLHQRTAF